MSDNYDDLVVRLKEIIIKHLDYDFVEKIGIDKEIISGYRNFSIEQRSSSNNPLDRLVYDKKCVLLFSFKKMIKKSDVFPIINEIERSVILIIDSYQNTLNVIAKYVNSVINTINEIITLEIFYDISIVI